MVSPYIKVEILNICCYLKNIDCQRVSVVFYFFKICSREIRRFKKDLRYIWCQNPGTEQVKSKYKSSSFLSHLKCGYEFKNLTYLKGIRTRYRNYLEKELENGTGILQTDLTDSDVNIAMTEKCIEKLNVIVKRWKFIWKSYLVFLMKLNLIFLILFCPKTFKFVRMLWNVA